MTHLRTARRGAFTLLEVLLASSLAIVLMAALYVALDVQLRLAADGRDAIDQATLTRAIVQRFENDLAGGLGPVAPPVGNQAGMGMGMGGGAGGGAAPPPGGGAGGGTGGAGTGGAGAPMGEDTGGDAVVEEMPLPDTVSFQAGVIGEADRLTLFVARVASLARTDDGDAPTPADVRRVSYWHAAGGLARQELPWVTSERLQNATGPDIEDGKEEQDYVIAEEVTRLQFEYWDGGGWADTWDGRQPGADGRTPKGPPMAIRVRFWLRVPGPEPGETVEKEFRHTIAVRGAPGPAVPETTEMPPEGQ